MEHRYWQQMSHSRHGDLHFGVSQTWDLCLLAPQANFCEIFRTSQNNAFNLSLAKKIRSFSKTLNEENLMGFPNYWAKLSVSIKSMPWCSEHLFLRSHLCSLWFQQKHWRRRWNVQRENKNASFTLKLGRFRVRTRHRSKVFSLKFLRTSNYRVSYDKVYLLNIPISQPPDIVQRWFITRNLYLDITFQKNYVWIF